MFYRQIIHHCLHGDPSNVTHRKYDYIAESSYSDTYSLFSHYQRNPGAHGSDLLLIGLPTGIHVFLPKYGTPDRHP